ncbi:hypothetical protein [Bifidobacterium catulorum]|uniref:Uncharacterized protein n=1 Tax=Bifidobacterium catulorum TaxID=1630173 RepID=A0A2U2MSG6_9BIFI|nr:hypothetical protein [Bifidobacterium catulorum]PWG59774.1 hypothetical protein DF200_05960 [Bifidobacterium catulorum]
MGAEDTTAQGSAAEDIGSLPDWAQKLIHGLRDENAAARVRNKEAADALTEAQAAAKLAGDNASQLESQLKAERFARMAHKRPLVALLARPSRLELLHRQFDRGHRVLRQTSRAVLTSAVMVSSSPS